MRTSARTKAAAVLLALAAVSTFGAVHPAAGEDYPHPRFFAFGTLGVARGQTARVSVTSVGPRIDVAVEITFVDGQGRTLARRVENVRPGHAVFLDLPFTEPADAGGNRLAFHAVVRLARRPDRGYVIPTLEVIDDVTGATTVLGADPEG